MSKGGCIIPSGMVDTVSTEPAQVDWDKVYDEEARREAVPRSVYPVQNPTVFAVRMIVAGPILILGAALIGTAELLAGRRFNVDDRPGYR